MQLDKLYKQQQQQKIHSLNQEKERESLGTFTVQENATLEAQSRSFNIPKGLKVRVGLDERGSWK